MNPRSFFPELKRPFFEIPNWAVRLIVLASMTGFSIALVMAWAFEFTPEGLKGIEGVDLATEQRGKSHPWIYVVVTGVLISGALVFLGRYTGPDKLAAEPDSSSAKSIPVLLFDPPRDSISEDARFKARLAKSGTREEGGAP